MLTVTTVLWLFPIMFMVHELEEIILIKPFKNTPKYINAIRGNRKLPYVNFLSAESFSVAVLEEYLIIIAVTIHAWHSHFYYAWIGLFVGVTLHHLLHLLMCLKYKGFVPGAFTSIFSLILSILILGFIVNHLELKSWLFIVWSIAMSAAFVINLKMLHHLMDWFEKKLQGAVGK